MTTADETYGRRSPARIEADIEATRERLAGALDELGDRLQVGAVLRRSAAVSGLAVAGVAVLLLGALWASRRARRS